MNTVYVATGSNIGKKLDNCFRGIAALDRIGSVQIEQVSKFYLTEPMYYSNQPWFVNAAVRIRTGLGPFDLLKALKRLEWRSGREDHCVRFGPRVIDFDIIFYNEERVQSADLVIPHPRMHQRGFVLHPMVDIAPDFVHPVLKKTMQQLLEGLNGEGQRCIPMAAKLDSAALKQFTGLKPVRSGGVKG